AVRAREVRLVDAEKVADLDDQQQRKIARRIEKGEEATAVVAEYLGRAERRQPKPSQVVTVFAGAVRRAIDDLAGRTDEMGAGVLIERKGDLSAGRDFIADLLARCPARKSDRTRK